ncbi:MAG: sugar ABC transporter permease [Aggregatilineales bacterium]|nr:sugar ABC transporter permease [Chloroflexota bacterium]HPT61257.1 sugar ABC transporter permease [Bacillota bacterium]
MSVDLSTTPPTKAAKVNRHRRERWFIVATLGPALLFLLVYVFYPTLDSFVLSFFQTRLYSKVEFVGLQHYLSVLSDRIFWQALFNTLYYAGGTVIGTVVFGLALALMFERTQLGSTLFRAGVFMPYVIPYAAHTLLWYWLFDPRYGLINIALEWFGINPVPWLQSRAWVIPAFILMSVWKRMGFAMVIFIAGLRAIDDDLLEAAIVDGAGWWQRLWHIILPLLKPMTLFVAVINLIQTLQLFMEPFVMTKGGPSYSSVSIVYLIYQQGFRSINVGRSSAMAVILFILIMVLTLLLMRSFRTSEVQ